MQEIENGCILTQDELREIFAQLRDKFNLDYNTLSKITGANALELEAWENGFYDINKEGVDALISFYGQLSQLPAEKCQ